MDDRTTGASPHELLLALAGRIDDDLLAWCRELVAVGEDGHALELLTATLIADRTSLPAPDRAAVIAAARSARTDLDADAALATAEIEYGTPHRFDAGAVSDRLADAVGALPPRQVAGCRTWVTSRLTPAGTAPGPLPHPLVLVEVGVDDARPVDVLAYQIAIACDRAGVPAAVEVVVAGAERPEYQQAALRTARPVHVNVDAPHVDAPHVDAPPVEAPSLPAPDDRVPEPSAGPAHPDLFATPVPEVRPDPVEFRADPEPVADPEPEAPAWRAAGSVVLPPAPESVPPEPALFDAGAPEPAEPAPVRRSFTPLRGLTAADGPRPGPARTITPIPRPAGPPSPVPIGRRAARTLAPVADDGEAPPARPLPGSDTPALASLGDPLGDPMSGPIEQAPRREAPIDEHDPLGVGRLPMPDDEEPDPEPTNPAADSWLADWISGDWAMSPSALTSPEQPSPERPSPERPSLERPSLERPSLERPSLERPSLERSAEPPPWELPTSEPFDDVRGDRPDHRTASYTDVPAPPVTETPGPEQSTADPASRHRVSIDRVDPPPPRPARRRPIAAPQARPSAVPPEPAAPPESALEQTGFILRPESVARLSDADRELLARLQSELGESPKPRISRRAGIATSTGNGSNGDAAAGTNGRGHRPSAPPDLAG